MKFDLPKGTASIIKVIGVGGGGSNAVNHMYRQGISGVDFVVCNTDHQALENSPVPDKLQLGDTLTEGMGAGSIPDVGRNAAIESADDLRAMLDDNTRMVFITAGMGGGTGTGAAPILASVAKEMGVLTVGIVTMPFLFEGRKRKQQAEEGIEELRNQVDTLLIINNDRLRQMYGNLKMSQAFEQADNVLATAAKGIAEIITRTGHVNVDFQDVSTVMKSSGVAIMGSAISDGENRAIKAVENALASPLLNDNDIKGARYILLNMEYGTEEITMDEITDITDFIQEEAGSSADIIWGYGQNEEIEDGMSVTVIATGFNKSEIQATDRKPNSGKVILKFDDEKASEEIEPLGKVETPTNQEQAATFKEPFLKSEGDEDLAQRTIEFDMTKPDLKREEPTSNPVASDEPFLKQPEEPAIPDTHSWKPEQPPVVNKPFVSTSQDTVPEKEAPAEKENKRSVEEQQSRVRDRIAKLKDLNRRLRTSSGLSELEDVPAYQRRQVKLDDVKHSSESEVSRYSLDEQGEEGEKRTGINPDNSFLHDNVD